MPKPKLYRSAIITPRRNLLFIQCREKPPKYCLVWVLKPFSLLGKATDYDVEVSEKLAFVLSGGNSDMTSPLTEDDMLTLELEAFVALVKQPGTLARLEHMLKTGKPLRN